MDVESDYTQHQYPWIVRGVVGRARARCARGDEGREDEDLCGTLGDVDTLEVISRYLCELDFHGAASDGRRGVLDEEEGGVWGVERGDDGRVVGVVLGDVSLTFSS